MATPHFYINPDFSGLSPLSRKKFRTSPLQVTQFLEGPTPPPPPPPPLKRGGGGGLTMKLPNKNDNNKTKIQLLDKTNMLQINFITYKGN